MYSCSIRPALGLGAAHAQTSASSDGGRHDRGAAQPASGALPGRGQLRDERVAGLGREPRGLSGDQASMACGVGTPRSRQSWNIEYLPASRRGRSAGGPRERNALAQRIARARPGRSRPRRRSGTAPPGGRSGSARSNRPGQGPLRIIRDGAARRSGRSGSGNCAAGAQAPRARRTPARPAGPGCGSRPGHRGAAVLVELEYHRGGDSSRPHEIGDHRGQVRHTTTRWGAPRTGRWRPGPVGSPAAQE